MYDQVSQKQLESMIKKLPVNMKIKYKKESSIIFGIYESYFLDDNELFFIQTQGKHVKAYITNYFRMLIQKQ